MNPSRVKLEDVKAFECLTLLDLWVDFSGLVLFELDITSNIFVCNKHREPELQELSSLN